MEFAVEKKSPRQLNLFRFAPAVQLKANLNKKLLGSYLCSEEGSLSAFYAHY